jgi:putative ABC transport system substrate-binding protein
MRLVASALAVVVLVLPLASEAQKTGKLYRVGYLSGHTYGPLFVAFARSLREFGYRDHQTVQFVVRTAGGDTSLLGQLASEILHAGVDVIVADTTPAAQAASSITRTIPIVAITADALGAGLVVSLARPGGNLTGLSLLSPELAVKRLELLREALPRVTHVGVVWEAHLTEQAVGLPNMRVAARSLGLRLSSLGGRRVTEYEAAFATAVREGAGALLIAGEELASPGDHHLITLAERYRMPVMYDRRDYADAGGLMAYGVSIDSVSRSAAGYVDKILHGVNVASLPVEQPTKFEFVINLKAAKALRLTIPGSVILRADQTID